MKIIEKTTIQIKKRNIYLKFKLPFFSIDKNIHVYSHRTSSIHRVSFGHFRGRISDYVETKHKSRQRRRNGMRAEADCFLAVNGGDGDVDTLWYPGVHIAARCIHNGHCHVIDPRAIREVGMHVLASVHIRIQLYA